MIKRTKLLTATLSLACLCNLFPFTAMAKSSTDQALERLPEGFQQMEHGARPGTLLYANEYGAFHQFSDFEYNLTDLVFDLEDAEKVKEIYSKYQEELNFDCVYENERTQQDAYYALYLYDKSDAVSSLTSMPSDIENKQKIVTEMLREMVDSGVHLRGATFQESTVSSSYGGFATITFPEYLTDEQLGRLEEIFSKYEQKYTVKNVESSGSCFFRPANYYDWEDFRENFNFQEACVLLEDITANFPDVPAYFDGLYLVDGSGSKIYTSDKVNLLTLANTSFGDVNLDGKIDLTDTIMIKKYEAGAVTLAEEQKANADLDGNGTVDSNDAVQLLRFLLRLEESIG